MKELQVRNRQRDRRIHTEGLRRVVRAVLEEELRLERYQLAVHLISATRMAAMNEHFLQHSGSTDVITFDYRADYPSEAAEGTQLAGEIFISVADAIRQAREFRTAWEEEVMRYAVHGILHLSGYDDLAPARRRVMKREENRLMKRVRARFSLAEVAG